MTPTQVSQDINEPDKLSVRFKVSDIFMDQEDFTTLELDDQMEISFPIPPQVPVEQYAISARVEAVTESSAGTLSILTIGLSLCLGYGLKFVWKSVNTIQFIVFIAVWQIPLNLRAQKFI